MKTRNYSWVIVILLVALAVLFFVQKRKITRLTEQAQVQAVELSQLQDSVLTYTTKYGQMISKVNSVEIDKRNLREALEASGIQIKELKDKDIQWRKLVSVLRAELEVAGEGTTAVTDTFKIIEHTTDTVYYQTIKPWTNGYLSLFEMTIENNNFDFSYNYKTPVEIYTEQLRKKTIVTFSLPDPEARITTAASVTIDQKKKFFERPVVVGTAAFLAGFFIAK